jgi:hypothetical protein
VKEIHLRLIGTLFNGAFFIYIADAWQEDYVNDGFERLRKEAVVSCSRVAWMHF